MSSISQMIEILSKEKGIESHIVSDALKDAMVVAARKHFKSTENLVAEIEGTGINIYALKKVVEVVADANTEMTLSEALRYRADAEIDQEIKIMKPAENLGRIAAQTAKQVILQKVREAERETIFGEYNGRIGELVNTTVKRVEGMDIVVDLGKTEARLPKREQSRTENYTVGDRIRVVIKSVEKQGKNAGVVVSRAAPDLVARLFEQEVPEIYDGTVVIKSCAREAGERTKIAVMSRDRDVDCVGACVGMKGMRVQSIIRELRGEKIDIIEFNDEPSQFAINALSPARISRVQIVDPESRHMEVIVDDAQLSLAIGKKGQNVRLAAKLLGWRIDIKSEDEKRAEVESAMHVFHTGSPISILLDYGLPELIVEHLVAAGIGTVERVGEMTPEELETLPNIGPDEVQALQTTIMSFYGQLAEPAAGEEAGEAAESTEAVAEAVTEEPEATSADAPVEAEAAMEAGPATEAAVASEAADAVAGDAVPGESATIEKIEGPSS